MALCVASFANKHYSFHRQVYMFKGLKGLDSTFGVCLDVVERNSMRMCNCNRYDSVFVCANYYNAVIGWTGFSLMIGGFFAEIVFKVCESIRKKGER